MMQDVPSGTQIGVASCPGCGAEVPLKKNVAGGIYFYCARVLSRDPATGKAEKCLTRMNIGRTGSRRMVQEFLANKKDITEHHAEPENREPVAPAATIEPAAAGGDAGSNAPAGEPGGFGAALKRFLTD